MNTLDLTTIKVPETLIEAVRYFSEPKVSVDFFCALRWPDGVVCPHCQSKEVGFVASRLIFKCKAKECRKQFSPKAGTIFEDSSLGLDKWLIAIWLIGNCKNGVSSYEIARDLEVTQKTAWFILHRIRVAMQTGTFEKLSGTIEVYETFIGGKEKNKHKDKKLNAGRGSVGKTIVMGLLERGDESKKSRVAATTIPDTTRETLHSEIMGAVEPGSDVMTDAARGYRGLPEEFKHQFVGHAVKYAEGRVTTNGIENFWSLVDRTIGGTYVSVEPEHLLAYIDEQAFRFNERGTSDTGRFMTVLASVTGRRLTYKTLIGNPQGIDSPDPLPGGPRAD